MKLLILLALAFAYFLCACSDEPETNPVKADESDPIGIGNEAR